MIHITYHEMITLFGPKTAYALLLSIENAMPQSKHVVPLSKNIRLERVLASLTQLSPLALQ